MHLGHADSGCAGRSGIANKNHFFVPRPRRFRRFTRAPQKRKQISSFCTSTTVARADQKSQKSHAEGLPRLKRIRGFIRCGDRRGRGAKTQGFLRFLICPRDPLQGSAWSRYEALSLWRRAFALLAKRCLVVCAPAFAIARSRARFPPPPRQPRLKQRSREVYPWLLRPESGNPEAQTSTSTAQRLAERNLHRATCTEKLEDRCRATCVQQLAASNLRAAAWNNAACAQTLPCFLS